MDACPSLHRGNYAQRPSPVKLWSFLNPVFTQEKCLNSRSSHGRPSTMCWATSTGGLRAWPPRGSWGWHYLQDSPHRRSEPHHGCSKTWLVHSSKIHPSPRGWLPLTAPWTGVQPAMPAYWFVSRHRCLPAPAHGLSVGRFSWEARWASKVACWAPNLNMGS